MSSLQDAQGTNGNKEAFQNVQVVVRARPLNSREKDNNEFQVTSFSSRQASIEVDHPKAGKRRYAFDKVFNQDTTQDHLFDSCVVPIIDEVLQGYSCTVFAYGQTGTGKTFTMEGDYSQSVSHVMSEAAGIIPRAVNRIFNHLRREYNTDTAENEYSVRISFLELYNEQLTDLLSGDDSDLPINSEWYAKGGKQYDVRKMAQAGLKPRSKSRLQIVDDGRRGVVVQNLEEMLVHSEEEVFQHVRKGFDKRQVAQTKCNDFSSRSHAVFTLTIHLKERTEDGEEVMKVGKLNLVDLAGSECIGRSGARGKQRQEASVINKSLLTLGRVISALVEKHPHIPYRDSKLTRLLQDSLGGHTKTCIIATLSPASGCVEESLSTLDYAWRAKQIKNKPTANARMTKNAMLKEFTHEIDTLQRMLSAAREKDGIYLPADMYEELTTAKKAADMRCAELEELKIAQDEELAEVRETLREVEEALEESRAAHLRTKHRLEDTRKDLWTTKIELKERDTECEEKAVLLHAHLEAESALHGQAKGLLSELQGSVGDIGGLFAKTDRMKQSEDTNLERVAQYGEQLSNALVSLNKDTSTFVSQQTGNVQDMIHTLRQQSATQISQLQSLDSRLNESMKKTVDDLSALTSMTQQTSDETCTNISNAQDFNTKFVKDMTAFATNSAETVRDTLEQVCGAIHQQKQQLEASSKQTIALLTGVMEGLQTFSTDHTAEMKNINSVSDAAFHKAVQMLVAQKIQLQAFAKARKNNMEQAGADLLSTVRSAIDKMMAEQAHSTDEAVNSLIENGAKTSESFNHENKAISSLISQAIDSSQASIAKQTQVCQEHTNFVQTNFDKQAMQCEQQFSQLVSGKQQCASTATEIGEKCNVWQDTATNNLKNIQQTISNVASNMNTSVESLKESVTLATSNAQTTLQANIQQDQCSLDTNTHTLDTLSANLKQNCGQIASWTSTQQSSLDTLTQSDLMAYKPTGSTPAKRSYAAPSSLVTTSPHQTILARVRVHKSKAQRTSSVTSPSTQSRSSVGTVMDGTTTATLGNKTTIAMDHKTTTATMDGANSTNDADTAVQTPTVIEDAPEEQTVELEHKYQQVSTELANGANVLTHRYSTNTTAAMRVGALQQVSMESTATSSIDTNPTLNQSPIFIDPKYMQDISYTTSTSGRQMPLLTHLSPDTIYKMTVDQTNINTNQQGEWNEKNNQESNETNTTMSNASNVETPSAELNDTDSTVKNANSTVKYANSTVKYTSHATVKPNTLKSTDTLQVRIQEGGYNAQSDESIPSTERRYSGSTSTPTAEAFMHRIRASTSSVNSVEETMANPTVHRGPPSHKRTTSVKESADKGSNVRGTTRRAIGVSNKNHSPNETMDINKSTPRGTIVVDENMSPEEFSLASISTEDDTASVTSSSTRGSTKQRNQSRIPGPTGRIARSKSIRRTTSSKSTDSYGSKHLKQTTSSVASKLPSTRSGSTRRAALKSGLADASNH